mmetsp:Transcript_67096/g.151701  ORF Transcript_67096/g.151701 Transcript_67096/m.151701 type:complete len:204 (+) Transcript_67096:395-1006(+)
MPFLPALFFLPCARLVPARRNLGLLAPAFWPLPSLALDLVAKAGFDRQGPRRDRGALFGARHLSCPRACRLPGGHFLRPRRDLAVEPFPTGLAPLAREALAELALVHHQAPGGEARVEGRRGPTTLAEGARVAEDEQEVLGARGRHVEPPPVREEAVPRLGVAAHEGEDHHLGLRALERVHRVHRHALGCLRGPALRGGSPAF